ncbi:MAG: cation:dicarboxylase symporter family transporter, partial [Phycisphaerae bacterium]
MSEKFSLKQWRFTLILISAVILGAVLGYAIGPKAQLLKPFGDIFLNLLFTAVVPLIFFSLSSAIACGSNLKRLGSIAGLMLAVFIMTGIISAMLMLVSVKIFDPAKNLDMQITQPVSQEADSLADKIVGTFTVNDFQSLLSRRNIMAMIVFSVLIGLASQAAGDKGRQFRDFLISGSEVMTKLIKLLMFYAPIGLGAYFAYLVGVFGSQLLGTYARAVIIYYPVSMLYFIFGFS